VIPPADRELIAGVVARAFPPGTGIDWGAVRAADQAGYHVLRGRAGPRWLVPAEPRLGLPFLRPWRPYRRGGASLWPVLIGAYRAGTMFALPGVGSLRIEAPQGADWTPFGWHGDAAPAPAVHIGTPGLRRKLAVGLVDRASAEVEVVVKLPLGDDAGEAILHEARMLRRLDESHPGLAPRVLAEMPERGVAAQTPVRGRPTGPRITAAHLDWLARLVEAGDDRSLDDWREAFAARLAATGACAVDRPLLPAAIDLLGSAEALPRCWVHGDLAPWNLKRVARAQLVAIDWEEARAEGLPLFDLVHFHTRQAELLGTRWPPRDWQRMAGAYLDRAGIPRTLLPRLSLACVVDDLLRATERGADARADWLAGLLPDLIEAAAP
jgi:hypothetical protein